MGTQAQAAVTTVAELVASGNSSMGMLRFSESEQSYRKALGLDPGSAGALVGLGRLALIKNQRSEGLHLLDRALGFHPQDAEALAVKGIYFMQIKEFDRAIEILEQARTADPTLHMVYFNLGKSYGELRQFAKAEAFLRQAIDLNPNHFEAFSQLSSVQIQTGRIKDGIDSMERAIGINPLYLKGYVIVGSLYERAGKGELAIRLYRDGLRHNPNAFPLRERLCDLYALKGDLPSAYQGAIEIIKRRRNVSEDYLRLGTYAVALRQFATARNAFRKSIELNPRSWEGHCSLAKLYVSAHMVEEAREHYQAAVENNRGSYTPLNEMGLLLLQVDRNWDGSIQLFQQALEIAPSQPEPRLNMALAYARKSDYPTAEKFVSSVLSLTQPDDRIYQAATRLRATIQSRSFGARVQSAKLRSLK